MSTRYSLGIKLHSYVREFPFDSLNQRKTRYGPQSLLIDRTEYIMWDVFRRKGHQKQFITWWKDAVCFQSEIRSDRTNICTFYSTGTALWTVQDVSQLIEFVWRWCGTVTMNYKRKLINTFVDIKVHSSIYNKILQVPCQSLLFVKCFKNSISIRRRRLVIWSTCFYYREAPITLAMICDITCHSTCMYNRRVSYVCPRFHLRRASDTSNICE